jgi:hypothetical protein
MYVAYSPIEWYAGKGEDTGRHWYVGYEVADPAVGTAEVPIAAIHSWKSSLAIVFVRI